jgi:hypothetical protein
VGGNGRDILWKDNVLLFGGGGGVREGMWEDVGENEGKFWLGIERNKNTTERNTAFCMKDERLTLYTKSC